MDEDVDGPAAHQADGAGELVGDPIGDQARRPFLGEDRHGLLRDGALHAAAGDRALDRLVLGDVDARPDVERGGPVHGDERPRRHAPARFQPFGHGRRGLLRSADHARLRPSPAGAAARTRHYGRQAAQLAQQGGQVARAGERVEVSEHCVHAARDGAVGRVARERRPPHEPVAEAPQATGGIGHGRRIAALETV